MRRAPRSTIGLVLASALVMPSMAAAQNKVDQCQHIKITVDVKTGNQWKTEVATLALMEAGAGWKIETPEHRRGEDIDALVGTELKFVFHDGKYPINVVPSGGRGQSMTLEEQNQPHIVRVKAKKASPTAGFSFEITGANSPKAKINRCPGGSVSIIIE